MEKAGRFCWRLQNRCLWFCHRYQRLYRMRKRERRRQGFLGTLLLDFKLRTPQYVWRSPVFFDDHSDLKLLAGSATAAFIACELIVRKAINKAMTAATTKIHHSIETR